MGTGCAPGVWEDGGDVPLPLRTRWARDGAEVDGACFMRVREKPRVPSGVSDRPNRRQAPDGRSKDRTHYPSDKRSFGRPSSRSLTMPGSLRGAVPLRRVSSSSASACRARSRPALPKSAASGRWHHWKGRSAPSSQGRRDPRWRGQEDACA